MRVSTLDTELTLFFSRELKGPEGGDLVEKQNAEIGQMPVVANEAFSYGYEDENRCMVRAFRSGERPRENFDDGVALVELLMAAYRSAELEKTVPFEPDTLVDFVPQVARGRWNPRNR